MRKHLGTRLLSILLVVAILCGFMTPVGAVNAANAGLNFWKVDNEFPGAGRMDAAYEEEAEQSIYQASDLVRVSIVLKQEATLEAGFSTVNVAENAQAMSYRKNLLAEQNRVTAQIEKTVGQPLDVVWNLTLAANMISAWVPYGSLAEIAAVPGVAEVVLETRYEPCVTADKPADAPNMSTSSSMIGTNAAYAAGYTGAGRRIAIIDTGTDTDHQSFDDGAFTYALSKLAETKNMSLEDYKDSLDLLDIAEIADKMEQLNICTMLLRKGWTAKDLFLNDKLAFAFNYVDENLNTTHDTDTQGEHGSHVAGIAAANRYIPNGDGTFAPALEKVYTQGVAPDAQILTMKVFGINGGAYDSDYMIAIEDAIVLGADTINLSLGSGNPGFSRSAAYQSVMENLVKSDTVVTISAGNAGHWSEDGLHDMPGYLYGDDISMQSGGSPATFTNSLAVASVDNVGATGDYLKVGDELLFITETDYKNEPMRTIAGDYAYIFIDGFGTEEEFAAIGEALEGKIAVCSRGSIAFSLKAENAVANGAVATVVYNNTTGTISMNLADYTKTAPCAAITQADAALMKAAATPVMGENGKPLYYEGKLTVGGNVAVKPGASNDYVISDFSSWGGPGSLELKPEITAPGGNIYSVNGAVTGGTAYESMSGTSMAAPQVAGMGALVAQWLEETGLGENSDLTVRALSQSLLMSTAAPILNAETGNYYSVLRQGAGLANVGAAVSAQSYIQMQENATASWKDGKVKAELGDDPKRDGSYTFGFALRNFTENAQQYMLSAELFTQGLFTENGETWLDTDTASLLFGANWTVDGVPVELDAAILQMDFNGDGLVNTADVQAILDYVTGIRAELSNAQLADLSGDGKITSYDARLFLQKLNAGFVTLPASGKVDVEVTLTLTEAQKTELNAQYEKGAYVEGYVFAKQLPTAEGVEGTSHSIPVYGFYGNWSDPSMFEKNSYTGKLYGDTTKPYSGAVNTNNLIIRRSGETTNTYVTGNPYLVEASYPAHRVAVNSADKIYQYSATLIRNAAAVLAFITDEQGNVLYEGPVSTQNFGAYYASSAATPMWLRTTANYILDKRVSTLGVKEGDSITVNYVAVPEYYEAGALMTAENVKELYASGKLGSGAVMRTTLTVDDTAPEISSIVKDERGNLIVTASDNQYVASVQVRHKKTSKVYAQALPEQTEAGETSTTTLNLEGANVGLTCLVVVADYAGNETSYLVDYGGAPENYTGNIYGFTSCNYVGGKGPRCVQFDPDSVYYYTISEFGGMESLDAMPCEVLAAEYVNGYVYIVGADGWIYLAEQGEWADCQRVGNIGTSAGITDLAYNRQNKTLYAIGSRGIFYTVDLGTGALTQAFTVTVTYEKAPADASYKNLTRLAIDDEGNFYSVNYGNQNNAFLFTWTLEDVKSGALTDLTPIDDTQTGQIGYRNMYNGSLAWDNNLKKLIFASTAVRSSTAGNADNQLVYIDPQTGKGERVNSTSAGNRDPKYGSRIFMSLTGLYVVPSGSGEQIPPSETASALTLNTGSVTLLKGSNVALAATVLPWNLSDKSVTWTTADPAVATVDNGVITATGAGKTVITATTNASPNLQATCRVTVNALDTVSFSAFAVDSWMDANTDAPESWQKIASAPSGLMGGVLHEGKIYAHDGSQMYAIDPDSFEVTNCGEIAADWIWADAASAPHHEYGDYLFDYVAAISQHGTFFELIRPWDGTLNYFSLPTYENDPMAVIAFEKTGAYDYTLHYDNPAEYYFVLTESGELWQFIVFTIDEGESYRIERNDLGHVDLQLEGVSKVTDGEYASMIYDEATGNLLVSVYMGGDTTELYAIDPVKLQTAKLGDFGGNVHPVHSLYQYERVSELTVRLDQTQLLTYVKEITPLQARVLPTTYSGEVQWTSSDPTVAAVDASGYVIAVAPGKATITATSVATNENGETVSASCEVTVKESVDVDATVRAQIVTDSGAQWANISTLSMTTETLAHSDVTFTGAGAHNGKIFGSDSNFRSDGSLYMVDPDRNYLEIFGTSIAANYTFHDVTTAPAMQLQYTDEGGEVVELMAFDMPLFLAHNQGIYFLKDYTEGKITGWSMSNQFRDLAAIAYAGNITYTHEGTEYPAQEYLALGADGTVYTIVIFVTYDPTAVEPLDYKLAYGVVGKTNLQFADMTALTMTYMVGGGNEGLIVGHSDNKAELFYIDLMDAELRGAKIGNVPGAKAISGLYSPADIATSGRYEVREAGESVCSTTISAAVPSLQAESTDKAQEASGSLNSAISAIAEKQTAKREAAQPLSEITVDESTVTVTLAPKDASGHGAATQNGQMVVNYDAEKLTLLSVAGAASYTSANTNEAGCVRFAYAGLDELESAVVTLTFRVNEAVNSVVTVNYEEVNDVAGGAEELEVTFAQKGLQVVDGLTGEQIAVLSGDELEGAALKELAASLDCLSKTVDGVTYAFAGWFTEPQNGLDNWAANVASQEDLAIGNTLYAYYVNAGYLDTTIAYTSNASRATKVFALSTVPADLFANYGFVLSTAKSASDENLVIGGKIDGLNVAKLEKTTIYAWISVAPFSANAPKTANDFNGGLGGVYKDGTDGYISYALVTNMPVGKTVSARAYYTTLDGTIVYGSTAQKLLEANSNVTGLE